MIKFSLIMAAYNAEKYIGEAIESVLKQNYDDWELIIVDDGSVDDTPYIIDKYANDNPKIKVIHQKQSGTAAAARNTALCYVSGDYVQMLDADDIVREDLLYTYANRLKLDALDIVIPNCRSFKNDRIEDVYWEKKAPNNNYKQIIDGEKAFCLSLNWSIHGLFLIRNEIIQQTKYDPELVNGDELTTRKFLYSASRIGFADSYYYYRLNVNSTTRNQKNKYRMYETVLTDINIYQYAVNHKMSDATVELCAKFLVRSVCGHCVMFYKEASQVDEPKEREYALSILERAFSFLTDDIWNSTPIKYKIFYVMSGKNFKRFMEEMKLIAFIRRIKG